MFGNGQGIARHFDEIKKLGPISGVFVGDRHHAKSYSPAAAYFGVPFCCSEEEAKIVAKKGVVIDQILEFKRHELYDDLEVIPTPGHTPGALSYLLSLGTHRVLFIGDTIVPIDGEVDGEWRVWVNERRVRQMLETLELLASVKFDYIAAGSFAATGEKLIRLTPKSKVAVLKRIAADLSGAKGLASTSF